MTPLTVAEDRLGLLVLACGGRVKAERVAAVVELHPSEVRRCALTTPRWHLDRAPDEVVVAWPSTPRSAIQARVRAALRFLPVGASTVDVARVVYGHVLDDDPDVVMPLPYETARVFKALGRLVDVGQVRRVGARSTLRFYDAADERIADLAWVGAA